jgi:hypothetical protein
LGKAAAAGSGEAIAIGAATPASSRARREGAAGAGEEGTPADAAAAAFPARQRGAMALARREAVACMLGRVGGGGMGGGEGGECGRCRPTPHPHPWMDAAASSRARLGPVTPVAPAAAAAAVEAHAADEVRGERELGSGARAPAAPAGAGRRRGRWWWGRRRPPTTPHPHSPQAGPVPAEARAALAKVAAALSALDGSKKEKAGAVGD